MRASLTADVSGAVVATLVVTSSMAVVVGRSVVALPSSVDEPLEHEAVNIANPSSSASAIRSVDRR